MGPLGRLKLRILVLGGTRFLGQRVVGNLLDSQNEVTLISRRRAKESDGLVQVQTERSAGLAELNNKQFDLVLDFICYEGGGPEEVFSNITTQRYILISTSWMPRLWGGNCAIELAESKSIYESSLPLVTKTYLKGKLQAEKSVMALRESNHEVIILRLPIVLGKGDHTGRLDFFRDRFSDGGSVIVVDGGRNHIQIAEVDDLGRAVACWATTAGINRHSIWEGIPDRGCAVKIVLESMAAKWAAGERLKDVPVTELEKHLPDYLYHEPFWRETALPPTEANIFVETGMKPSVFISKIHKATLTSGPNISQLRQKELKFLEKRKYN